MPLRPPQSLDVTLKLGIIEIKGSWAFADVDPKALALAQRGDLAGASAAFQRATDSGNADRAPKAAVNLGMIRGEQGDVAGARAAYQRAIDSGHAEGSQG